MDPPYEHIACCMDDSDASRMALGEACRLRRLGPGRLSLVHVGHWPPVYYLGGFGPGLHDPEMAMAPARTWIEEQAEAVEGAEAVFLIGYPPMAACLWAEDAGVDLLVAAAHRGALRRAMLGSFASHLAHHAPCQTLLVRRPVGARGTARPAVPAATELHPPLPKEMP